MQREMCNKVTEKVSLYSTDINVSATGILMHSEVCMHLVRFNSNHLLCHFAVIIWC